MIFRKSRQAVARWCERVSSGRVSGRYGLLAPVFTKKQTEPGVYVLVCERSQQGTFRVGTAHCILDYASKMTELEDFEARLARFEERS